MSRIPYRYTRRERLHDFIVMRWYRWYFCRRYDHLLKMDSHGWCVNCGKKVA